MPQNLESDFLNTVRQRNQKKRKLISQRIAALLLIVSIASVLAYFIVRGNFKGSFTFDPASLLVSPITLYLSLIGLILVLGLVIHRVRRQASNKNRQPFLELLNFNWLKRVKRKYLLGFSLLLIVLICQANPSLFNRDSLNDVITRLKYNPTPPISNSPWSWKDHKTIHPIVARMTPDIEKSIASVAQYIAEQEPDPYLQIKALHDYVVSRVTYDLDVLTTGIRPLQDAQTVFATHKAVCEGYANLFLALGRAIGLDVVFIGGKIRQDLAPVDLIPVAARLINSNYDWTLHTWNAVKVGGNWQFVDTTWDDSDSSDSISSYSADYLMPPPQVMIMSHFPEQQDWQLLQYPKNYNSFEKQPILTPQFFAEELTIISPTEYQTNIQRTALIEIKHPPNYPRKVVAIFSRRQESGFSLWNLPSGNPFIQEKRLDLERCQSQHTREGITQIFCQFPEPGDYQVLMFSIEQKNNFLDQKISLVGQLRFHSLEDAN